MKGLVVLLGLLTASLQSGEAAVTVHIRAYSAIGEVTTETVPRGTRLLLICDVEGLPEGNVSITYMWNQECTGVCEIQEGEPYYTAVNDTLLVDATSWDGQKRHTCIVKYHIEDRMPVTLPKFLTLTLTDSFTPFLFTPTSLLLNNALITDVEQITGRNEQWITCTSGRDSGSVNIYSAANGALITGNSMNTATISSNRYPRNGLYHCSAGQPPRYYISLFLRNSSNVSKPIVSAWNTSMWTLTSPDGSRVERYILEFECRVRNITFVEKYMSVSASGGTGRVTTSVSCFGGLGQLYRVKVWAVSQPNISRQPAEKLVNTVGGPTLTIQVLTSTPSAAGGTSSLGIVSTTTRSGTPISTASITPSSSSGLDHKKSGDNTGSTFIGVGIGIFILLAMLGLVGLTVVVVVLVVVKGRSPYKQKGKMRANPCYNNPVVVELDEKDVAAEYDDTVKTEENGSVADGFDPYEDVDSKAHSRNANPPPLKTSSTPASATNVGELYAIVDMSKKKGAKKKEEENGCMETNKDDLYTVPMKKKDKMTDKGDGASGGAEKSEDNGEVAELKYEPTADGEPEQQSEGDEKSSNADMLYAVVDKSRKKKK